MKKAKATRQTPENWHFFGAVGDSLKWLYWWLTFGDDIDDEEKSGTPRQSVTVTF